MKVIKSGTGSWKKRITHKDCGSVLEIEATDVAHKELSAGYCETEWCFVVICPECGRYVELTNLPGWVEDRARANQK